MGYIYKITNHISKKCYIGETKKNNPYLRWNEHKRKIEQNRARYWMSRSSRCCEKIWY